MQGDLVLIMYAIYKLCDDLLEEFADNEEIKEKLLNLKEIYTYDAGGSEYYDSDCERFFKCFSDLVDFLNEYTGYRYGDYELIKYINEQVTQYLMNEFY